MMMNITRKNSLARVCSWLGDELLGEFNRPSLFLSLCWLSILGWMSPPDTHLSLPWGWLVLFIGKCPGPLRKYLSGKGANNWPIRRGTSGTLILTKVGLRLPKALW